MTKDEVHNLPAGELPVLCADGAMGLLTVWPDESDGLCGVQVPGEPEHRWINCAELEHLHGGALAQAGAPRIPTRPGEPVQMLLASDWAQRGAGAVVARIKAWTNLVMGLSNDNAAPRELP